MYLFHRTPVLRTSVALRKRRPAAAVAAAALALCLGACFVQAAPAHAQVSGAAKSTAASLDGDWTGALEAQGAQLHLVLHVKTEGGATTATLDSPDQGAAGIPVSSITRTGDKMTFAIDAIGGSYAGDVAAGDASITGTWSQNGGELPLTLVKK